jgi:hypothetical protein
LTSTPFVARWQIRANTVSTNRQNWINRVRSDLANLISKLHYVAKVAGLPEGVVKVALAKCLLLEASIEMSLNPVEADHIELIKLTKFARERATEEALEGPSRCHLEDGSVQENLNETIARMADMAQRTSRPPPDAGSVVVGS